MKYNSPETRKGFILKRKNYSKELKSKVALAAIKGDQTVNEIASEFGIHTSFVNRWKKEAIEPEHSQQK